MKITLFATLFAGLTFFSCLPVAPGQAQDASAPAELKVPVQGGIFVGNPGDTLTHRSHERDFNEPVAGHTLENQTNGPFLPPVENAVLLDIGLTPEDVSVVLGLQEACANGTFLTAPIAPIIRLVSGLNEAQYDSSAGAGPGVNEFLETIVYGVIPVEFWRWDPDEFDGIDDDIVGQVNPGPDSNNRNRDD